CGEVTRAGAARGRPRPGVSVDVGPPGRAVTDLVDAQLGGAVSRVPVVEEDVAVGVGEDRLVAGAVDVTVTGQDLRAAARGQRHSGAVHVRAGDGGGAARHDAVGAGGAAAAGVEGDQQVVVAAVLVDGRRLDRAAVAAGDGDEGRAEPPAGGRVELDHLDAGPERAEAQPPAALVVDDQVGVDGVVVVGGERLDDQAL